MLLYHHRSAKKPFYRLMVRGESSNKSDAASQTSTEQLPPMLLKGGGASSSKLAAEDDAHDVEDDFLAKIEVHYTKPKPLSSNSRQRPYRKRNIGEVSVLCSSRRSLITVDNAHLGSETTETAAVVTLQDEQ